MAALDRLAPPDFYHRLDRLRAEWHADASTFTEPDSPEGRYADGRRQDALDIHERKIAVQLRTLRRLIEQLPPRFHDRAMVEYEALKHARLVDRADWLGAITRLARIVSEWNNSRPPIIDCPSCGANLRGQQELRAHLLLVHQIEEG